MIKLVAIDLDDTLLNSKKQISQKNTMIIKNKAKKGTKFVIATGRPFVQNTIDFHKQLGLFNDNQLYIGYNGAAIYDVKLKKPIYTKALNNTEINEIEDFFKTIAKSRYIHLDGAICCNMINDYSELERTFNSIDIIVGDLTKYDAAYKYMVADEPKIIKEIFSKIPSELLEKYNIFISMPCFIEVIKKEINKYDAVKKVAEHLNINENEIMAIGDSMNDYEMIKYAKVGVAMAGAVEPVKEVADFITLTNDLDGVGYAIDNIIKE